MTIRPRKPSRLAGWFHDVFGDRYFIEIQNNGVEIQRLALRRSVDVANRLGLPLVATSDAHYVDQDDAEAQDVMLCINTGKFRTDTRRMKMEGDQFYLRPPGRDVRGVSGPRGRGRAQSGNRRSGRHRSGTGQAAFSALFAAAGSNQRTDYLRKLCLEGLKERYADDDEMCSDGELLEDRAGSARSRTGRDREAGLSQLLPDCLGLCPQGAGAGHSGHGAWQRRRGAGLLLRCT